MHNACAFTKVHTYTSNAKRAPHIARGDGLHVATTGVPTSFTIDLLGESGPAEWAPGFNKFIYVWIASEDQVMPVFSPFRHDVFVMRLSIVVFMALKD